MYKALKELNEFIESINLGSSDIDDTYAAAWQACETLSPTTAVNWVYELFGSEQWIHYLQDNGEGYRMALHHGVPHPTKSDCTLAPARTLHEHPQIVCYLYVAWALTQKYVFTK